MCRDCTAISLHSNVARAGVFIEIYVVLHYGSDQRLYCNLNAFIGAFSATPIQPQHVVRAAIASSLGSVISRYIASELPLRSSYHPLFRSQASALVLSMHKTSAELVRSVETMEMPGNFYCV